MSIGLTSRVIDNALLLVKGKRNLVANAMLANNLYQFISNENCLAGGFGAAPAFGSVAAKPAGGVFGSGAASGAASNTPTFGSMGAGGGGATFGSLGSSQG